jgi:glycosyltransferase involved in cell wall biosynthesis
LAVTVPPELNWLLDILAGQSWPQGDEDALRRCSQAWMDAMLAIGNLADCSDVTARSVMLNADSTSSDQFQAFWSTYLSTTNPGFGQSLNQEIDPSNGVHTTFGDLFKQCEQLAGNLVDQANEVEYTKLVIVITVIITAIMIAMAIAEAIATLGASLVEVGLAMFIGREAVVMAISRFLQMALMMLVPDLIAQGVLVAQGKGWDWNKTWSAGENAVVGGLIGAFLGAGVGKLGWMGEGGNRFLQLGTHFVEGGLVMDATTVTTLGGQYLWADLHGDKNTMAAIEQQLSFSNLAHQFLQGGLLSTVFYLPHMAVPHGTAVTFTADNGQMYRVIIGDKTTATGWTPSALDDGQLPAGVKLPVYNDNGIRVGTVEFDGGQAKVTGLIGGNVTSGDLAGRGYSVVGHDGSIDTYHLADQSQPELMTQVRPSDGAVVIQTPDGPVTVPKGSMVHYTADGSVYRADIVAGNEVTTWQNSSPGKPLEVTGVTVHSTIPLLSGVFGVRASKVYGADGTAGNPVATVDWFRGKTDFTDPTKATYYAAVTDRYSPHDQVASSIAATPAGLGAAAAAGPHVDAQLTHDSQARQQDQESSSQEATIVAVPVVVGPHEIDQYVALRPGQPPSTPQDWSNGQVFAGASEAASWAERVWDPGSVQLSADQRTALEAFVGDPGVSGHGAGYQDIKRYLRGDNPATPEIERDIASIDDALTLRSVPNTVVVDIRIPVSHDAGLLELDDLAGRVWESPNYLLSSFDAAGYGDHEVALHLTVPEGTPALYLGTALDSGDHELLLGRGLSFQIDDVTYTDTWHIQAHVITDAASHFGGDVPYAAEPEQPAGTRWSPGEAEVELAVRPLRVPPDWAPRPDQGASESYILVQDRSRTVYKPEEGVWRDGGDSRWIGKDLFSETWEGSDLWAQVGQDELRYRRELATYSTDQMLGFHLVPTTAEASYDAPEAGGIGSIQEFVPGRGSKLPEGYIKHAQQQMAVLDYVIANSDRHGNNYLTGLDRRPVAIDNGETFPPTDDNGITSRFVAEWLGKRLYPSVLRDVRAVDLAEFRDMLLARGIGEQAADRAVQRLDEIQRRGMITGEVFEGDIYRFGQHQQAAPVVPHVSAHDGAAGVIGGEAPLVRVAHVGSVQHDPAGFVRVEITDGERSAWLRLDANGPGRRLVISADGQAGQDLRRLALAGQAPDGFYDLVGHADEFGFVGPDGLRLPFAELKSFVPDELPADVALRLVGCRAAGGGLAELADATDRMVRGSGDVVWMDRRGAAFASSAESEGGELRPHLTDAGTADGSWQDYRPHGGVSEPILDRTPVARTDAQQAIPLAHDDVPDFALKDILGTPKAPPQPEHEVAFEDGRFVLRDVPPAAIPGSAGAVAAELSRGERLALIREHFLADHPVVDERDLAEGIARDLVPPWLEGKPAKIMLVTTFWDITAGGVPVFNRELANAFADAGHEVYVAVLDENLPREAQVLPNGITLFTHAADLPAQVDIVIGHTRFSGQQAQEIRANFYPDAPLIHFQHMVPGELGEVKAGAIIYRAPRVDDYQVVVYEKVNGTVIGRYENVSFAADTGVARLEDPLVIDGSQVTVNGRPATVGAAFFNELRKAAANDQIEQTLLRQADLGLAVGPAIRADMVRSVEPGQGPPVEAVFPGLDFTRVVTPAPLDDHGRPVDGQYNVLLIGRADEAQKGALEAAHMIRGLHDSGLDVRLTIRGFDPTRPADMQVMAQRLTEIAGAPVEVLPFTSDPNELTADLNGAHLVIAPGSGEGFGMSAAGASAVGVPVLVPSTSGYGMFLADPRNVSGDLTQNMLVDQGFADQIPVDRWVTRMRAVLEDLPAARASAGDLATLLHDQDRTWHGTAMSVLDALRDLYRGRAADEGATPRSPVIDALRVEIIHDNSPAVRRDSARMSPPSPHAATDNGEPVRVAHVTSVEHDPAGFVRLEFGDGERSAALRLDASEAGRRLVVSTFDGAGEEFRGVALAGRAPDGMYDLVGHADEAGMVGPDGLRLPFAELRQFLPDDLPADVVLRVCGCRAAAGGGLADLADAADRVVRGSSDVVWMDRRGNTFASRAESSGEMRPHITAAGTADGSWVDYRPRGGVSDPIPDHTPLGHIISPDDVFALGAGDVFDRSTMFGPRSAAELQLPPEVQDFAGHSGYLSPPAASGPSEDLPYRPDGQIAVNIELQHFAENAIGVGYIRAARDLRGEAGKEGYTRVLADGDRSGQVARQAANEYRQRRQAAGEPPPGKSSLARYIRHAAGRFREFGRLTDEAAVMHDDVYLVNGGKSRGETDPVLLHDIPVNIHYSARYNAETDPEPKPGYTMVDFPKNGSYPEVLTALEFRRQHYAGPASEFDRRYANAMLNLVRDQPRALADSVADLSAGLREPHVAELYKLAKDCFGSAEFDKFVSPMQRDPIDAFGRTEIGRFIKSCAALAVLNVGLEGARCPETFFTSLMTWNLVADGRVSLPDALGYFNVMGTDHAGLIADHAEWTRDAWLREHASPTTGIPGPKGTLVDPRTEPAVPRPSTPQHWVLDEPTRYVNGIPDVRNSVPAGVEEFQRREREILGLYAQTRGMLADLTDAFSSPGGSTVARQRQLRLLIDELFTKDMGWLGSALMFADA